MTILSTCDKCGCETLDYWCGSCLDNRIKVLEDALETISQNCLHKDGCVIWEAVKATIGADGEKREA